MHYPLKVLLVEDSAILSERLSETIQQTAGVTLMAATGTEAGALEFLKNENVDVLILDLHLRQGTGFGVMRALTQNTSNVQRKPRILVLTNYDLPEYQKAAIDLGATYFLDKARDYGRLPEILREMSGRTPVVGIP